MKYKAIIEYCGTFLHGMQKNGNLKTVQSVLEDALFCLFEEKISFNFSGRTDAGVHAIGQVIDFETKSERDPIKVMLGMNFYLKGELVSCVDVKIVKQGFHSRFDAKMRHYVYKIINRSSPLTFEKSTHLHLHGKLNTGLMQEAGQMILGKFDFQHFTKSPLDAPTTIKTISHFDITEINLSYESREIHLHFGAKSFLHNMVRRIVGSLIMIGKEKKSVEYMNLLLKSKTRDEIELPPTASACGLYLLKVDY